MPLEMPETDEHIGKCGMPSLEPRRDGPCNKPGVKRVAVGADDGENDYEYRYTSTFRVCGYVDVMVDICADHNAETEREFKEAAERVAARENEQARIAAQIREAEDRVRELKRLYPGTWRE